MKKVKVLFAWLLTFILLFVSSFVVSGEPDNNIAGAANAALPSGNMENICTKGDFTLFASMLTGEFAVRNNASGKIWYSNPADKENDPFAGTDKSKTFSLLALQYIEEDTLVQGFITGYEAQENGGVSVEKTDDGISVFYKYDDLRIAVPLDISLTDKGIKASINVKKIHEESNKKILNISMLPYFCAGNTKDDGYIVVPDGCGALIDFNSGRQDFASYSQPLYGRDVTVSGDTNTKQEENSALPLFGIKKGDMGFAAIITKGDAAASIVAGVSKKGSGYNNTYADFTLRSTDKVVISGNSMDVYEQNKSRLGSICVEYRLLSGDNADTPELRRNTRNI